MMIMHPSTVERLVRSVPGMGAGALELLDIDHAVAAFRGNTFSRAIFATALAVCLFGDLMARVPSGAAYAAERVAAGGKLRFDHGAIRTIRFGSGPTGALPGGDAAFRRILEPLGYVVSGRYPLPALCMTGRAYCHVDHPETIPQYFVSELHVDRFQADFAEVAQRVFGSSRDPLGAEANELLASFRAGDAVPVDLAVRALPQILAAFERQHSQPTLVDYEALLASSAEAAWIATEGNAYNHATDRVVDVEALAAAQKALGRPMKDRIEVSASGRVRQTAFKADQVIRRFHTPEGEIERAVPGSFFEFISRAINPETNSLDLGFDSSNATGIFKMTVAI